MLPAGIRCPASAAASSNSPPARPKPCMTKSSQMLEQPAKHANERPRAFQQAPSSSALSDRSVRRHSTAPAAMPEEVSASSTSALGPDMALIAVPGARYEVMASVAGTVNQTSICEGFLQ